VCSSDLNFNNAFRKMISQIDMPIYIEGTKDLKKVIQKGHINPKVAFDIEKEKIYLHKIYIKKDMNIIFLSNSIYYENNNKTLPAGMDITDEVLIDLKDFNIILKQEKDFRIIEEQQDDKTKLKEVFLKEYDIEKRKDDDK